MVEALSEFIEFDSLFGDRDGNVSNSSIDRVERGRSIVRLRSAEHNYAIQRMLDSLERRTTFLIFGNLCLEREQVIFELFQSRTNSLSWRVLL